MREGPSTDTHVQIRVATGQEVTIEQEEQGWQYVKYGSNHGFMMAQFLQDEGKKCVVTGKNVALREGPSTSMHVRMRIATGKTVDKATVPDTWLYVSYGGRKGFMMKEFLNVG